MTGALCRKAATTDWEAQLNQVILATDIREGWGSFVELFDRFYDEEVMVVAGYEGAGVSGQGANRERLLQVLVPLHVLTELDVVQIERFELKESVVAESGETRSTWLLEPAKFRDGFPKLALDCPTRVAGRTSDFRDPCHSREPDPRIEPNSREGVERCDRQR